MLLAFEMDVCAVEMNGNHVAKRHGGTVTYLVVHDTRP